MKDEIIDNGKKLVTEIGNVMNSFFNEGLKTKQPRFVVFGQILFSLMANMSVLSIVASKGMTKKDAHEHLDNCLEQMKAFCKRELDKHFEKQKGETK